MPTNAMPSLTIPPTPMSQSPEMRLLLNKIKGPTPSRLTTTEAKATWPRTRVAYDKKLPRIPSASSSELQHTPSSHDRAHAPSRSHTANYPSASKSSHRRPDLHKLYVPVGDYQDNRPGEAWSTRSVADEGLPQPDRNPECHCGDCPHCGLGGYDSEDNSHSNYASLFDEEKSSSPSRPHYLRTRSRSCGPGDGRISQTMATDLHHHHQVCNWHQGKNESSHENQLLSIQETQSASPAMVPVPSPRETRVVPRPPRRVSRFTPLDPTRRHAMYISPVVWPADMAQLRRESDISESPNENSGRTATRSPFSSTAKWRRLVKSLRVIVRH